MDDDQDRRLIRLEKKVEQLWLCIKNLDIWRSDLQGRLKEHGLFPELEKEKDKNDDKTKRWTSD